jgi:hypothetical protein
MTQPSTVCPLLLRELQNWVWELEANVAVVLVEWTSTVRAVSHRAPFSPPQATSERHFGAGARLACVPMYPSDDSESWNDVGPDDRPPNYGEVLAASTFGDPVVDDEGDWVPIYEAAVEVCGIPVEQLIRALGQDLIRWRVVMRQIAPEVEVWLADVLALPGAHP